MKFNKFVSKTFDQMALLQGNIVKITHMRTNIYRYLLTLCNTNAFNSKRSDTKSSKWIVRGVATNFIVID